MIRYTEKGQASRVDRLEALRKRVKALKRLNAFKDSSDWKELKDIIQDFVESEQNAQNTTKMAQAMGGYWDPQTRSLRKESDSRLISDMRVAIEREAGFQLIIDLIEKTDEQIDHITTTIKSVEETFKQAKEQLA